MTVRREDLERLLREYSTRVLQVPAEALTNDAALRDDLGLDSIDMFDILAHVSDKTGRTFMSEDFRSVRTVSDFLDTLDRLASAAQGGRQPSPQS